MSTTVPGHDEITVSVPGGRHLCHDRAHRNAGRLADVIVSFGQLGSPGTPRQALWPEAWGRSYPMCHPCWEATRQTAAKARPNLVVRDALQPQSRAAGGASGGGTGCQVLARPDLPARQRRRGTLLTLGPGGGLAAKPSRVVRRGLDIQGM